MSTNPILRNISVRFDVDWRPPGAFLNRSLADLLAGCGCSTCSTRIHREPRAVRHDLPDWMSPEMQLRLYGFAASEHVVTVH